MKKYRKSKLHALDDLDQSIIQELQVNARQSYLSIGKKIGASEGTIRNRVNSELKGEVIKLKAVLNPSKIGFNFSCVIGIEIGIDKLHEAGRILAESPNVYLLVGCTGAFDLLVMLIFRDVYEFDIFLREKIATLPGIRRTQTFVNMSLIKTPWSDNVDINQLLKS